MSVACLRPSKGVRPARLAGVTPLAHHVNLGLLIRQKEGTMMKRIILAVAVLCGLAGATVGIAGLSATPAAACNKGHTT